MSAHRAVTPGSASLVPTLSLVPALPGNDDSNNNTLSIVRYKTDPEKVNYCLSLMELPDRYIKIISEESIKECYSVHSKLPELIARAHAFSENRRIKPDSQTTKTQIKFVCPHESCPCIFLIHLSKINASVRKASLRDHTCPESTVKDSPNVIGNKFFLAVMHVLLANVGGFEKEHRCTAMKVIEKQCGISSHPRANLQQGIALKQLFGHEFLHETIPFLAIYLRYLQMDPRVHNVEPITTPNNNKLTVNVGNTEEAVEGAEHDMTGSKRKKSAGNTNNNNNLTVNAGNAKDAVSGAENVKIWPKRQKSAVNANNNNSSGSDDNESSDDENSKSTDEECVDGGHSDECVSDDDKKSSKKEITKKRKLGQTSFTFW